MARSGCRSAVLVRLRGIDMLTSATVIAAWSGLKDDGLSVVQICSTLFREAATASQSHTTASQSHAPRQWSAMWPSSAAGVDVCDAVESS